MWHRRQFMAGPLKYILSALATNLVNYEWACTRPWSIEYDVRAKVDNDLLKEKLRKIYGKFYEYLFSLNRALQPGIPDEDKADAREAVERLKDDEIIRTLMRLVANKI